MTSLRPWVLPLLLVANGAAAMAIADRAAVVRRSWQAWEVRMEARAHLKYLTDEEARSTRSGRGEADHDDLPVVTP